MNLEVYNMIRNKKAVLSQGEPRDAAVNFDTYRLLQTFMYAKHGDVVDAGASGAKPSQNTLNHV